MSTISRSLSIGDTLKDGAYRVVAVDEKGGVTVERIATGSTCKASGGLIARTQAKFDGGESIPFRKISYTVAVETIVLALVDNYRIDAASRQYVGLGEAS